MEKKTSIIYRVLLCVGVVLIVCSMFCSSENLFNPSQEVETTQLEPVNIVQLGEGEREYYLELVPSDQQVNSIGFFTAHQYIEVYADDVCIYSLEGSDSVFGKSTGAHWNIVELAPGTKEVCVHAVGVYPDEGDYAITFYLGNSLQMALGMLRGSMQEIIVSVVDFAMGVLLIVYYYVVRKKVDQGPAMFYFGLFAAMMGLWSLNEAEAMIILLPNRVAASYVGYTLILLMIAPFAAYLQEFLEVPDKRISNALCIISLLNYAVCTILHMTGVIEFKKTVIFGHFLMLCDLAYLLYALILRVRRVGWDRRGNSSVLGLVILTASYVLDLGAFYLGAVRTDVVGRFGFLLYICILGSEAAIGTREKLEEGRKAEIYKELAVRDVLTGLHNRNAYDEWAGEHWKKPGATILAFDLNDLKRCNDTLGHAAGDRYLQDAAVILSKVFEPEGQCFRIGGDEFCAVFESADEEWLEGRMRHMEQLEREYNQTSDLVRMQIACGHATFDEDLDSDIEETRSRADALMYENKRALKAGR